MKLIHGDCYWELMALESNSVDSLVTDPPAGIGFMGKEWDHHKGGRKHWVAWMSEVMAECLRVLKPGAHGLVWALPRTSHWTATALEDAGFEVRDICTHLFGSGFPKSLDVSKAIDKAAGAERDQVGTISKSIGNHHYDNGSKMGRFGSKPGSYEMGEVAITAPATDAAKKWQGWGTALKPASEHWILVRKPISEKTVAANVLKWGTGALNIDASRIEAQDADKLEKNWTGRKAPAGFSEKEGTCYGKGTTDDFSYRKAQGRFPANLVFSHTPYCTDEVCDLECAIQMLDEQSGQLGSGGNKTDCKKLGVLGWKGADNVRIKDSGGASRFFYVAKISKSERNAGLEPRENHHPTVKPKRLMTYLIRMVTPPGGRVLDPFMGSGSTGVAARAAGFDFLGVEKEKEYFKIARKRIEHAKGKIKNGC